MKNINRKAKQKKTIEKPMKNSDFIENSAKKMNKIYGFIEKKKSE